MGALKLLHYSGWERFRINLIGARAVSQLVCHCSKQQQHSYTYAFVEWAEYFIGFRLCIFVHVFYNTVPRYGVRLSLALGPYAGRAGRRRFLL